jgi:hypothetical protein
LTAESRAVIDMDGHGEGLYQVGDIYYAAGGSYGGYVDE